MFKVVRIRTGEIVTVYGQDGSRFLIYDPNHALGPRWVWINMSCFKPVEDEE